MSIYVSSDHFFLDNCGSKCPGFSGQCCYSPRFLGHHFKSSPRVGSMPEICFQWPGSPFRELLWGLWSRFASICCEQKYLEVSYSSPQLLVNSGCWVGKFMKAWLPHLWNTFWGVPFISVGLWDQAKAHPVVGLMLSSPLCLASPFHSDLLPSSPYLPISPGVPP